MSAFKNITGFIAFDGKSVLNEKPILGIVVLQSTNDKTGNMAQLYILDKRSHPQEIISQKLDDSICGYCSHRHSLGGACYVVPGHGVSSVWRSYAAGKYPAVSDQSDIDMLLAGKRLRLGAYGDPAAIPIYALSKLVSAVDGNITGYTHQISNKRVPDEITRYCMLSADTAKQGIKFNKAGKRYFRVLKHGDSLLDNEILCPNSKTGIQCVHCMLCDGTKPDESKPDIAVFVHGSRSKNFLNNKRVK